MLLDDFTFDLPDELIAQYPLERRSASRLLYCARSERADAPLDDRVMSDLPAMLRPGDLLVMNDTRVIKARLLGRKDTGGRVEVMVERIVGEQQVLAQVRASHAPQAGSVLHFGNDVSATVVDRQGDLFRLQTNRSVADVLEIEGHLPLPPYIRHEPDRADEDRYQTVYSRHPGAVAAPTAGLHFDDELLEAIRQRGIDTATLTLHVGAGTFQPVRVDDLSKHVMHAERYFIPEGLVQKVARVRARGARIIAVGTTTLRALESAVLEDGSLTAGEGETRLFIVPGFDFRVVDVLLTNFHLPRSTLLMLVSAFAGKERIAAAYRHAISKRYRFFSYGDAMLLEHL